MNQEVVISFLARTAPFLRGSGQVIGEIGRINRAINTMAKVLAGVGLSIFASFGVAGNQAAFFERNMRNVNSIVDASPERFKKLNDEILRLATTAGGKMPADLAGGAYQIASAGFDKAAEITATIEPASRAATAGLTDTNTAATALVTALNAYSMEADQAEHVSDVLFQTVNKGQVTFEQLAINLGDFIGIAQASGATLEETLAAYAAITIATGQPARSATLLQATFRALLNPTNALKAVLKDLGYTSVETAIQQDGLEKVLRRITATVGNDATAMYELFANVEAVQGVLALQSRTLEEADANLASFTQETHIAGITQKVFEEQSKSTAQRLDQLKAVANVLAIQFGDMVLPAISNVALALAWAGRQFAQLPEPIRQIIGYSTLLAGAVAVLGGGYVLLWGRIGLLLRGFRLLHSVMKTQIFTAATTGLQRFIATTVVGQRALDLMTNKMRAVRNSMIGMAVAAPAIVLGFFAIAEAADWLGSKLNPDDLTATQGALEEFARSGQFELGDTVKDVEDLAQAIERYYDLSNTERVGRQVFFAFGEGADKSKRDVEELDKTLSAMAQRGGVSAERAERAYSMLFNTLSARGVSKAGIEDAFSGYLDAVKEADLAQRDAAVSGMDLEGVEAQLSGTLAELSSNATPLERILNRLNSAQRNLVDSIAQGTNITQVLDNILDSRRKLDRESRRSAKEEDPVQKAMDYEQALLGIEQAELRLIRAEKDLSELRERDIEEDQVKAEQRVADAALRTERARRSLLQAERDLAEIRRIAESGRTVEEAEVALERALMRQAEIVAEVEDAHKQLAEAQDHGTAEELASSERRLQGVLLDQKEAAWAVEDAQRQLDQLRKEGMADQVAEAELSLREAQSSAAAAIRDERDATDELKKVREDQTPLENLRQAELDYKEAVLGVKDAHHQLAETQKKEAVEGVEDFDTMVETGKISLQEFQKELENQITTHENWFRNLQIITERYGAHVAAALASMGPQASGLVQKMATDTTGIAAQMADDISNYALLGSQAFVANMVGQLSKAPGEARTYTKETAAAISEELGIGIGQAITMLESYGMKLAETTRYKVEEVAPGRFQMVKPGVGRVGPQMEAYGGIYGAKAEQHLAQIAKPGQWRVWAEPETGGEAYIPLASAKRQRSTKILSEVAGKFGYKLNKYAEGGILPPALQEFRDWGVPDPLIPGGMSAAEAMWQQFMRGWYDATKSYRALAGEGSPQLEAVGRQLQAMGFAVSEHPAFGGVLGRHAPNSYHYRGRAIDVNFYPQAMEAARLDLLAAWLRGNVPHQELLWRTTGHLDHLHLAMARGGVVSYDQGGWLNPGYTVAYNGTGRAEPVGYGTSVSLTLQMDVKVGSGYSETQLADQLEQRVKKAGKQMARELYQELRKR